jgi:hypothetical protein
VVDCKPTEAHKDFRGPYDAEKVLRSLTPSFKETKELLEKFFNMGDDDSDDDKKSSSKKSSKKKKKNRDV